MAHLAVPLFFFFGERRPRERAELSRARSMVHAQKGTQCLAKPSCSSTILKVANLSAGTRNCWHFVSLSPLAAASDREHGRQAV